MAGSNTNTSQTGGAGKPNTETAKPADGTDTTKNPDGTVKNTDQTGFENQAGDADKAKPTDTDADKSVGTANPNQQNTNQGTGAGSRSDGTDAQGAYSREGETARVGGEPTAAATLGQTVTTQTPGRLPAESGGFSPIPSDDTGKADSDRVPFTQAVQRLVPPEDHHPISQALGTIVNVPPGSRPMMLDPVSGLGIQPPQVASAEAEQSSEAKNNA